MKQPYRALVTYQVPYADTVHAFVDRQTLQPTRIIPELAAVGESTAG